MIHIYFLGAEAFVILGYLLGSALFPKRYPLIFYKFFGLTMFSLLVWYLSLVSGNGWTTTIPTAFVILMAISIAFVLFFPGRVSLPSKKEIIAFIGVELLSYVIYLFLVYIRTFKSDVLGTEKLMDVALINTIMKQNHIPIENPWLSGFYMNYYYFGHFILGMLQYLFNIPTAVGYNLAISLIGVWIVQAGYLVVRALRLTHLPAFFISLLMTFGGNLFILVQYITNNTAGQWFASATRVIPYTINEFPSYSIILGDLHGHYLSYPFFLLGVFLLIDMFVPNKTEDTETHREEYVLPKSLFLGILLGHLYLTNSWDILSLALLGVIFVMGTLWYRYRVKNESKKQLIEWGRYIVLFVGLPIMVTAIPQFLSSRSYYLPPVGGIGVNTMFSNPWEIFMLFGQFIILTVTAGVLLYIIYRKVPDAQKKRLLFDPKLSVPLVLFGLGIILILTVELFYAKDVFTVLNPPYARTNTVFKIYFHAWSFLALGSMVLLVQTLKQVLERLYKPMSFFVGYVIFSLVVAVMVSYPVIAIKQYIAPSFTKINLQRINDARWNNGYAYMKDVHGADYELISYLLTKPFTRILEVVTYDSYSYFGRISAYTGNSTVSGWPLHNVQWYNGYDGKGIRVDSHDLLPMKVADRVTDIEKMYTSTDKDEVKKLLEKYQVELVVFGSQEYTWSTEKSKTLNQDIYNSLCKVDWQQDGTTLYRCRE